MREIADIVRKFERQRGEAFALATLVRTQGSSYRKPGARMLISADGSSVGSISGGCLEAEVVERALTVIQTGEPAWMTFDTRRRFGCNGVLEVFVEAASEAFLVELVRLFHRRATFDVMVDFSREASRSGTRMAGSGEVPGEDALLQSIHPAVQLLIVGDGPETEALRAFAKTLGWDARFCEGARDLEGPFDEWTAAIVKTHNYGRDFAALRALLPQGLRYIGLLGPRKRREQLLGDLLDTGVIPDGRIHGPAGLDLGSDSPESVALAVVAEIQGVFADASFVPLREKQGPIHAVGEEALAAE
jgi:xanthine/CO dehydrogenase XdhC/CoxF family maturation factor